MKRFEESIGMNRISESISVGGVSEGELRRTFEELLFEREEVTEEVKEKLRRRFEELLSSFEFVTEEEVKRKYEELLSRREAGELDPCSPNDGFD
ncbi:hypothetical protein ACFL1G_11860 [Planctomycetota bacterium]